MFINNININNFKAKLLDRNIGTAEIDIINNWSANSLNPYISNKFRYKYKVLKLTLDVICSNDDEIETMKSNIIKQLAISTIKFQDIDIYYRGFISDTPSSKHIVEGNEILEVTMLVVAEKEEKIEVMNRVTNKTIDVDGDIETPAIVEIIPSITIADLVINGLSDKPITIKNLTGGKKVIIGEETVTVDGINKFNDCDMWEFPRLKPGINTIAVSRNNVDINIKYKSRYI